MENIEFKNDHDILIVVATELKGLRADVKEIRDNTQKDIADHCVRLESLEKWRGSHTEFADNLSDSMSEKNKLLFGIGLLILALIIWHLTGYHI